MVFGIGNSFTNVFFFKPFIVEAYLRDVHAQTMMNAVGVGIIPTGCHVRDDEQVRF